MRRSLAVTLILVAAFAAGSCKTEPGWRKPNPGKPLFSRIGQHVLPVERTVELVCEVTVSDIPPGAREVRVWIPFPQAGPHQQVMEPAMTHPTSYRPTLRFDKRYGTRVLYISGEAPVPESFTVSWSAQVGRARIDDREANIDPSIPDNEIRARFAVDLEPVHLAPLDGDNLTDDETARQIAAHAVDLEKRIAEIVHIEPPAGDNVTEGVAAALEVAEAKANAFSLQRAIYDYVIYTLTPDNETREGPQRTVKEILKDARGDSGDYALVTTALLRAGGIPARIESGVMLDEDKTPDRTEAAARGAWVRFLVNGRFWSACDPYSADRFPELKDYMFRGVCANRVHLATGPLPQLVPAPVTRPPVIFADVLAEAGDKPVNARMRLYFRDVSGGGSP